MRTMIGRALTWSLLLGGMIFTACNKDNEGTEEPFTSNHCINSYMDTPTSEDEIRMMDRSSEGDWQGVRFVMYQILPVEDVSVHYIRPMSGNYFENKALAEKNAAKFDSLATAHNDTSYNAPYYSAYIGECLYRRTTGIHVVSDADYDGQHPAGTYLDDLIRITFMSAEDFFQTDCTSLKTYLGETTKQGVYDLDDDYIPPPGFHMSENLAEFNSIQRKLIQFSFSFKLTQAPDQSGTHRFTITYTNEDGVVLSGTIDPITITLQE